MTNCTQESFQFPVLKRLALLKPISRVATLPQTAVCCCSQQVDRRLGLSEAVARTLDDPRRQASIDHNSLSLLRQRVYALALGYEDLNDHETLRLDLAIQTIALGRTEELASSPTLCRWENRADRETADGACMKSSSSNSLLLLKQRPKKLILDFDATDDVVHGNQEDRFFHGYYDHWTAFCLCMSFAAKISYWSVTCARARSTAPSMPGRSWLCWLNDCDRSGHKSELSIRGDSGFCRWRMLLWCERNNVGYIVGIAKNKRLNALTAQRQRDARDCYATNWVPRCVGLLRYPLRSRQLGSQAAGHRQDRTHG